MDTQTFLELLLPPEGWLFSATQATGKGWINSPHKTIIEVTAAVARLTTDKKNAYFALASYEQARVWDPLHKNEGGSIGRWSTRTQANAKFLKSFWMDLDVDPENEKKFASKEAALKGLIDFTKEVGLPRPMVVDSGGGLHVYWPLVTHVPSALWKDVAVKLKAITVQVGFRCDHSLTADEARVLRAVGGYNHRRNAPVLVLAESKGPYEFLAIKAVVDAYCDAHGIAERRSSRLPAARAVPPDGHPAVAVLPDNLGETNDPLHFDRIAFSCAQIGAQAACRGRNIGEPLWHAGIGIAKFCEPQDLAVAAISDGHPSYTPEATRVKVINWRAGPTTCAKFHTENKATCEDCPRWGQITSPAQLGRTMVEAAAPVLTVVDELGALIETPIPDPPAPYKRRKNGGIVVESEDKEGAVEYVRICPYDLYPIKIMRQFGDEAQVDEHSMWRAHLPRLGATDINLSQSLLGDTKRLYAHLLSKGMYMSPDEAKSTQVYMSAYLHHLAQTADREKLYEHLGWYDNATSFVLGSRVLHRDGTSVTHTPSNTVKAVTGGGFHPAGTLDAWRNAINFYAGPGYEARRMYLYAGLGSPLLHMTGHKGAVINAAGDSGKGKTQVLLAAASMWGHPVLMSMNGNKDGSTVNAMYEHLGCMHSLPFLLDDTTERESDELRRLYLNISQGKGKERMRGHEHSMRAVSWACFLMTTTNSDMLTRIMGSGTDAEPHLMRFISLDFTLKDTSAEAKIAADHSKRELDANFGHAGPIFMEAVIKDYDKVKALVERNMDMITRRIAAANSAAERIWVASIAVCYTAAQISNKLGLMNFPYEEDLTWMIAHLGQQRESMKEVRSTPRDNLSAFLEKHFSHALILSAKNSGNLDNVAHRPMGSLYIRHELDAGLLYVSRPALIDFCAELRIPFRRMEQSLMAEGVILSTNIQKVLGADTIHAKGQTRCWRVDANVLSGATTLAERAIALQQAMDAAAKNKPASNVVPIAGGKAL